MKTALLSSSIMLISLFTAVSADASKYEEPSFTVIHKTKDYEIRRYDSYIVAEATVSGDNRQAGSRGFQLLAGYIFGNNSTRTKMNMTAPVTKAKNLRMNMTIPVTTEKLPDNRYVMHFVMERKYTLDSLPKPNDSRVTLRQLPERIVAVRRYSGRTSEANFKDHRQKLLASLTRDKVSFKGTPVSAVYDGPWTLPFRRRNEVLVQVDFKAPK